MESLKRGESGWGIGATEFAIGAAVFKTTEGLAKTDELNYPQELGWYWTDDGSDDCSLNPNTRLCNDNVILNSTASEVWKSIGDGSMLGSWTTPAMSYEQVYDVVVEVQASAGASWISDSVPVQVNRVPELTVLDDLDKEVTYLDSVRFSVLYMDGDGDAPASIQLDVGGQLLDMHPPAGSGLDYASGVEYHYVLTGDDLGAPGVHLPTYRASDGLAYRAATAVQGGKVTVTQAAVATHTFESDPVGGVPRGFTKSNEALNYWRVADTGAEGMRDYVALGGHGNAVWFARSPQGTYSDPDGGARDRKQAALSACRSQARDVKSYACASGAPA